MGVYIFTWKTLRKYLVEDAEDPKSEHDFGNNIIPKMLNDGLLLQAYRFKGYWRDVGTLASLHQANMDIALNGMDNDMLNLYDSNRATRIYTEDFYSVPQYIGPVGSIKRSIANQGAIILGNVDSCVISSDVVIEEEVECTRCVIMRGARIKVGAKVHNAIIGPDMVIESGQEINLNSDKVVLLANGGSDDE